MMTKDSNVTNAAPSLVSVSTQAAVLVTLPATMATADMGTHILQGAPIKEETEDELSAGLTVGNSVSNSVSNGNNHNSDSFSFFFFFL